MRTRFAMAVAIAAALTSTVSSAAVTTNNALLCPSYSAVAEANAAIAAKDNGWFARTECFFALPGQKIVVVRSFGDVWEGQFYSVFPKEGSKRVFFKRYEIRAE